MVSFLSPEWVTALDTALRNAGTPPASDTGPTGIVIQHVVTADGSASDGPDGDDTAATYALEVTATEGAVTAGHHANPTVTYTQARSCARAIASGDRSPHDAFMLGELTISGDTQALIAASDLLAWLDSALADVRATTSYED